MLGFRILEQQSMTDVGLRRSHNQDAYTVRVTGDEAVWRERGHLFLVADGMGAHAVGELASKLAADLIPHTYQKYTNQGAVAALSRAFLEANAIIHQRGQQNREFQGMGTTGTALLLRPEGVWVAHVGDSRAYRIRAGHIEQLSFDHSLQWEWARRQGVDPDQIEGIPSNVIVRSLGPEPTAQVDIEGPHPILPGDTFLLCSDGLSNQINDHELGAMISALPVQEVCPLLVDLANLRGGPDNITLVAVRLPGEGPQNGADLARLLTPPSPRRRWADLRLPWSGITLSAGTTLAILTFLLVIAQMPQLAVGTFLAAAAVLAAGLIVLHRSYQEEKRLEAEDESCGAPRVYRRTCCQVDQPLLHEMTQLEGNLRELVLEKGWPLDWETHRKHLEAAEELLRQGDVPAAFRAQCRALALVTEAIRLQRQKEEVFQPLWERAHRFGT
jgi:protein phosphatase